MQNPIETFKSAMNEVKKITVEIKTNNKNINQNDLNRIILVYVIAAMETYFKEKYSYILIPFLKKNITKNTELLNFLSISGISFNEIKDLLPTDTFKRIKRTVQKKLLNRRINSVEELDALYMNIKIKDLSHIVNKISTMKNIQKDINDAFQKYHQILYQRGSIKNDEFSSSIFSNYHLSIIEFTVLADWVIEEQIKTEVKKTAVI